MLSLARKASAAALGRDYAEAGEPYEELALIVRLFIQDFPPDHAREFSQTARQEYHHFRGR